MEGLVGSEEGAHAENRQALTWIAQCRDCLDDTREPVVFVDTVRKPETCNGIWGCCSQRQGRAHGHRRRAISSIKGMAPFADGTWRNFAPRGVGLCRLPVSTRNSTPKSSGLSWTRPYPSPATLRFCGEHGFNKPGRSRTYSGMELLEHVKTLCEHPAVA